MGFVHCGKAMSKKIGPSHKDPTADIAITKVDLERMDQEDRFRDLLDTIYYISDLAGFDIEEHIVLRDRKTGKVWK